MSAQRSAVAERAGPIISGEAVSQALARFAAEFSYESIPEEVRERAKLLILDAVGIAFASTRYDFAHRALSGVRALAGEGPHAVIGRPERLPVRDAALLNGILVHGLDYDDTHMSAIVHPTASAFPCALAAAERAGAPGSDLLAAYVLGVEVATRLGQINKGGFHHVGYHPTGILGHFACALVAGRLLGLSAGQLVHAQGIAYSTAAGPQEFLEDGAWTKRFHPGWAAASGITAAALAAGGFTGPTRAYEGRFGLFNTHLGATAAASDYAAATRGLGREWELFGVAVKPFPTCHFTHACADSALALVREHGLRPEDVRQVRALLPAETIPIVTEPVANKLRPSSDYDAKFSIQFILAACLARGRFGLAELAEDALKDPAILALAETVKAEADPDSPFPKYFSGGVVVTTRDGRELVHRERVNRGAGERALSAGEISAKFFENATLAVSRQRAEAVRQAVLGLDSFADSRAFAARLALA